MNEWSMDEWTNLKENKREKIWKIGHAETIKKLSQDNIGNYT